MSIVGDIDGGASVIVQDNWTEAGVMGSLLRDDVNGRLPVPFGNRVVYVPL